MIDYVYKELFDKDSVDKQIVIAFDDGEITNTDLYSESLELQESLCSDNELRFGSCEASVLKLKIRNEFGELKDKWLDVSMTLAGNTDIPFQFGRYKVYTDEPSGDRKYKNITAYNAMYDIINSNVADWYNTILPDADSTVTLKEFRDSFAEYFGLEQEEVSLINDDMIIGQTIAPSELSGKIVICAICELNGCFGQIGRDGKLKYVFLGTEPVDIKTYISSKYEDFTTDYISRVQIRQKEGDIGGIAGSGENCYIVEDNFLVYGKTSDDLEVIAGNLLSVISNVSYRPFSVSLPGNPCLEVGDRIKVTTKNKEIESYILERTLKGIQALKDSFSANGVKQYAEKLNSVRKEIAQLKGMTNVLERTVQETRSEITNVQEGVSTQINQKADEIMASVYTKEKTEEIVNNQVGEIKKHFIFNVNGMEIIVENCPNKIVIDNDHVGLWAGNVEVLSMDTTTRKILTPVIEVKDEFKSLGYVDREDTEGRINTRWVGV